MVLENTERELNINDSLAPERTLQEEKEKEKKEKKAVPKRRKAKVFSKTNPCRIFLKTMLLVLPLIIFAIFFSVASKK